MKQITNPKELVVGEWYVRWHRGAVHEQEPNTIQAELLDDGTVGFGNMFNTDKILESFPTFGPIPNTGALKTPEENK